MAERDIRGEASRRSPIPGSQRIETAQTRFGAPLKRILFKFLLVLITLGALGGAAGLGAFYWYVVRPLPVINSLADYTPKLITQIRSRDGQVLRILAEERRIVAPIERIPEHVKQAFVASEDSSFYDHQGLDYKGIARAFWENLKAGGIRQGGSTITQQVAKTFLLTSDRTVVRKLKDMVLALRIEQSLPKNQILYLYINQIYLGSGAYGVEAAAQTYFDKSAEDLTIAEAAIIVGCVPAPTSYSPLLNPDAARKRQLLVLKRMLDEGYITQAEHDQARDEELHVIGRRLDEAEVASQYFVEEVRRYLEKKYGRDMVLTGGLDVTTTLDVERQVAAWRAVRRGLRDHDHRRGYRGPIRQVPRQEWERAIQELGEQKIAATAPVGEPWLLRGLVVSIDDRAEKATLAIGPDAEVSLQLKDLKWARPADPNLDGAIPRVRKVSDALGEGWLVRLEKVADSESGQPRYLLYQKPQAQSALLSIDIEQGWLDAMIGGYDFDDSQFNRAIQAKRQPGSSFKPIIYAEALLHGYTPATIVYDTPKVFTDDLGNTWKPQNYSYKFYGPITLREALARSRNVATIKILQDIGIPSVLERAERLGIRSDLQPNLALALGSSEATLLDMVRAYTAFPAGGRVVEPIYILEVRDRDGNLLEQNVPLIQEPEAVAAQAKSVDPYKLVSEVQASLDREDDPGSLGPGEGLDPITAYQMTHMLTAVVEEGTGSRVRALGRPVAGKTGTTNDLYDAWFIGFTPRTVAGVWVGYDNAENLGRNETGSRTASPVFLDYMKSALRDEPIRDFQAPPGVEFAQIDKKTGLRSLGSDLFIPFAPGTAPEEFAPATDEGGPRRAPRLD